MKLFNCRDLNPLLHHARSVLSHDKIGLCAFHEVSLMGRGELVKDKANALWIALPVSDGCLWIAENFDVQRTLFFAIRQKALHYNDACAQKMVPADGAYFASQTDLLKPQGVGMHLRVTSSLSPEQEEAFVRLLWDYNCHEKVARPIFQDLLVHGQRTTTVQFHLLDRWNDLKKDLRAFHVSVDRVLPRLNPLLLSGAIAPPPEKDQRGVDPDLSHSVLQLQKQFSRRPFKK